MADKTLKDYWAPSFDALYDACFYELASERIIDTWYWIDLTVSIFTVVAVLGSLVSGWALWANNNGKIVWESFAATAFAFALVHSILAVPIRIKREGERRQPFATIRVELQALRRDLLRGIDVAKAEKRFDLLRGRLRDSIARTPPDIVFTWTARRAVQKLVNERLRNLITG